MENFAVRVLTRPYLLHPSLAGVRGLSAERCGHTDMDRDRFQKQTREATRPVTTLRGNDSTSRYRAPLWDRLYRQPVVFPIPRKSDFMIMGFHDFRSVHLIRHASCCLR